MMQLGQTIAKIVTGETSYALTATKYKDLDNCVVLRNLQAGSDPAFGVLLIHYEGDHKIYIKGTYPTAKDDTEFASNREEVKTIKVTDTKKPHLIAKDVLRFLESYVPVFEMGVTFRDSHNKYLDKRQELAERFAKILHGKVSPTGERVSGGPSVLSRKDKRGHLRDFYVSGSTNSVDMYMVNIPADLAEAILDVWLKGWVRECRCCNVILQDQDLDICYNAECPNYKKEGFNY